ncbi:MAG: ABC transporter permease subunit [Kovacikia sp.]
MSPKPKISLWKDVRFWRFAGQAIALILLLLAFSYLVSNLNLNLQRLGIRVGFDFLNSQAGFAIGDSPIPYQPANSYGWALLVGLINSLRVIGAGLVLATIVGVAVGIARLSDNWLVRNLAMIYVEVLRNVPLLLQLFFWYFAIFFSLPSVASPLNWLGVLSLSKNGMQLGNLHLSSEFSALLLGLAIYTATFIAEVVRGGIQSVPQGQWEAARSLGLKPARMMGLVIFPQALRAIVPPLANQYLNLAKNSSLAIAIGYSDLYAISATTFNQTGRAVEVMALICGTYLTISLTISLLMNFYNRSVQLVER